MAIQWVSNRLYGCPIGYVTVGYPHNREIPGVTQLNLAVRDPLREGEVTFPDRIMREPNASIGSLVPDQVVDLRLCLTIRLTYGVVGGR